MGLVDEYEQRQLAFIEHVRSILQQQQHHHHHNNNNNGGAGGGGGGTSSGLNLINLSNTGNTKTNGYIFTKHYNLHKFKKVIVIAKK